MQQFQDFIVILAFFIVYLITRDIFIATGVLMAGFAIQIGLMWVMKKPISGVLKFGFWASMVLGTMTLVLRDEAFIQWKPSVVYWVFSAALLGRLWIAGKYALKDLLGSALKLPDDAWRALTYGWAIGFAINGVANIWVANTFSMDTWVTFKVFGTILIQLFYLVLTFVYLYAKGLLNEENLPAPDEAGQANASGNATGQESDS